MRRRSFLKLLAVAGQATAAGASVHAVRQLWGPSGQMMPAPAGQEPVRPPGARPEAEFWQRCIGCYLCGEVCPPACIEFPSEIQGVDVGIRRPRTGPVREEPEVPRWKGAGTPWILPWITGCTLCMKCTEVCPTGALEPPKKIEGKDYGDTNMGRAMVDEKICLPFNRVSWCGSCYTACPLKNVAIEIDYRNRPTVLEGCVGCGLCVEVCPIKYKAIAVTSAVASSGGRTRRE